MANFSSTTRPLKPTAWRLTRDDPSWRWSKFELITLTLNFEVGSGYLSAGLVSLYNNKLDLMKLIVLFCLALVVLGLRHTHKSQYDLGYEAGLMDALEAMETHESLEQGQSRDVEGCEDYCDQVPLLALKFHPECKGC